MLPPVTPCILEKIQKGEYIDFGTVTTKAMFGAPEPQTSFALGVNPSGDSLAIQPTSSHKQITAWLEAWNIFLAVMVDRNPVKASRLIAYHITSPNSWRLLIQHSKNSVKLVEFLPHTRHPIFAHLVWALSPNMMEGGELYAILHCTTQMII